MTLKVWIVGGHPYFLLLPIRQSAEYSSGAKLGEYIRLRTSARFGADIMHDICAEIGVFLFGVELVWSHNQNFLLLQSLELFHLVARQRRLYRERSTCLKLNLQLGSSSTVWCVGSDSELMYKFKSSNASKRFHSAEFAKVSMQLQSNAIIPCVPIHSLTWCTVCVILM